MKYTLPETPCNTCPDRKNCAFFEEDATECPYDALAMLAGK